MNPKSVIAYANAASKAVDVWLFIGDDYAAMDVTRYKIKIFVLLCLLLMFVDLLSTIRYIFTRQQSCVICRRQIEQMIVKKHPPKSKNSLQVRRLKKNFVLLLIKSINYKATLGYHIDAIRQLLFESSVVAYTTAIATSEIATIFLTHVVGLLNFSKFIDRELERKLKSFIRIQTRMLRFFTHVEKLSRSIFLIGYCFAIVLY